MEFIENQYGRYPVYQSQGFAAQFAFPFADKFCTGIGYDIGCNRKEWALKSAIPVDPQIEGCTYDAYNLPEMPVNFIFSSHCLEHLPDWVEAINYWHSRLAPGGCLFLYLPHYSQQYWRPWNNRKHIHALDPKIIKDFLEEKGCWKDILVTDSPDLNNSFYVVAHKK